MRLDQTSLLALGVGFGFAVGAFLGVYPGEAAFATAPVQHLHAPMRRGGGRRRKLLPVELADDVVPPLEMRPSPGLIHAPGTTLVLPLARRTRAAREREFVLLQ